MTKTPRTDAAIRAADDEPSAVAYFAMVDVARNFERELALREGYRETLQRLVDEQAEDEGLWFVSTMAPVAYLQAALRKLHAAVEGDEIAAADSDREGT